MLLYHKRVAITLFILYNSNARAYAREGCEMGGCRHTDSRCLRSRGISMEQVYTRL